MVIQIWMDTVKQARVYLIDLIKDEHGVGAPRDVPFDPLLQLRLKKVFF